MDRSGFEPEASPMPWARYTRFNYRPVFSANSTSPGLTVRLPRCLAISNDRATTCSARLVKNPTTRLSARLPTRGTPFSLKILATGALGMSVVCLGISGHFNPRAYLKLLVGFSGLAVSFLTVMKSFIN